MKLKGLSRLSLKNHIKLLQYFQNKDLVNITISLPNLNEKATDNFN